MSTYKYLRKVIKITAEDSPNVRLGLEEQKRGYKPSGREVIPGILSWDEYADRRQNWDRVMQCVGLDAEFWKGPEELLYPPEWLNLAHKRALEIQGSTRRGERALGMDPAAGGDKTAICAVDDLGILELISEKTPDTATITGKVVAFARKWNIEPKNWIFDAGGGGQQHADRLRLQGHKGIRVVAFGEKLGLEPKRGLSLIEDRREIREQRVAYFNRRAQMYWQLRDLLDPSNKTSWGIPRGGVYDDLRKQMAPIPLTYNEEGIMYLLPKNKRDKNDKRQTLTQLIGRSPDELDALVLAIHGRLHKSRRVIAGALKGRLIT